MTTPAVRKTVYLREVLPPTYTPIFKSSSNRVLIEGEGHVAGIRDTGEGPIVVTLTGGIIATFTREAVQCVIETRSAEAK